MSLSRRDVLSGASVLAALGLAGCNAQQSPASMQIAAATPAAVPVAPPGVNPDAAQAAPDDGNYSKAEFESVYGPVSGEPYPIAGLDWTKVNHAFLRRMVTYSTTETVGTIVVDPHNHYLYHIMDGGRAMRYGVGVGRQGFAWNGVAAIHSKQQWPDWYPPQDMFERTPEIKKVMSHLQSGLGMHGGPGNPLGARAMYLWQKQPNGKEFDTLYRIHGTVEPYSIGTSVSSGCIRMMNQDAIELWGRTTVGTKVVVIA